MGSGLRERLVAGKPNMMQRPPQQHTRTASSLSKFEGNLPIWRTLAPEQKKKSQNMRDRPQHEVALWWSRDDRPLRTL